MGMSSESMKQVFSIIVWCGNYMNGGNPQRGQADGFAIDILPKLNDVKSNNSSMTLLHYIVRTCILKFDNKKGSSEARNPVPEPMDIDNCGHVNFEESIGECNNMQLLIVKMEKLRDKVIRGTTTNHVEPFKEKMTKFLQNAQNQLKDLLNLVNECSNKFENTKEYYKFVPKDPRKCQPKDFFSLWFPFCSTYKVLWKEEQAKIAEEIAKEARAKERKNSILERRNSIRELNSMRERNSLIQILVTPRTDGFRDRIEKSAIKERKGSRSCRAKRRITFGSTSKEETEIFNSISEHFGKLYLNKN